MDSKQFDRWTRTLAASPPSRRALLKTLAGGALGGLLGLIGLREAAAACRRAGQTCSDANRCCQGSRCRGGRCKCKEDQNFFACNGPGTRCVNVATSEQHCGGCGNPPCGEGEVCLNGGCVPMCADGLHDGLETDVDCGGPDCDPCAKGKNCEVSRDCAGELTCASDGTCQEPDICDDGIKNGRETDVDCGGPGCPACPDGKACFLNDDCANNFCDRSANPDEAGVCRLKPTCNNGTKDGDESDVDCGGSDCPKCGLNQTCNSSDDCRGPAFCVNRAGDGSDKKFCVECAGGAISADDVCGALYGDARPRCVNYRCTALGGTCSAGQDICKLGFPAGICGGNRCGQCRTTTEGATACLGIIEPRCSDRPCTSSAQCVNRFGPGAVCAKDSGSICGCNTCMFPC